MCPGKVGDSSAEFNNQPVKNKPSPRKGQEDRASEIAHSVIKAKPAESKKEGSLGIGRFKQIFSSKDKSVSSKKQSIASRTWGAFQAPFVKAGSQVLSKIIPDDCKTDGSVGTLSLCADRLESLRGEIKESASENGSAAIIALIDQKVELREIERDLNKEDASVRWRCSACKTEIAQANLPAKIQFFLTSRAHEEEKNTVIECVREASLGESFDLENLPEVTQEIRQSSKEISRLSSKYLARGGAVFSESQLKGALRARKGDDLVKGKKVQGRFQAENERGAAFFADLSSDVVTDLLEKVKDKKSSPAREEIVTALNWCLGERDSAIKITGNIEIMKEATLLLEEVMQDRIQKALEAA
jgi:hypothetical protein